jgi:hypothetical protein
MEEILASIRRIIADDDASKTAPPPEAVLPKPAPVAAAPPPPPTPPVAKLDQMAVDEVMAQPDPPSDEPDDVLDLTESMTAPASDDAATFQTIDGESDIVFSDRPADPPASPPAARNDGNLQVAPSELLDRTIMSPTTATAVDSAFNTLANTVLVQNARTLEDLVKEMLRPMLKTWLDDNLPGLVERIVRAEIERVSRGRP